MQRLRQLEPSWLRSGQTTSLVLSETEKELVRLRGGGMTAHAGRGGRAGIGELGQQLWWSIAQLGAVKAGGSWQTELWELSRQAAEGLFSVCGDVCSILLPMRRAAKL